MDAARLWIWILPLSLYLSNVASTASPMPVWRWHDDNPSGLEQSEPSSYRGQPPGSDDSFQPQEQDYENTGTDQAENLYGDSLTNTGSSFPEEEDNGSTSIDQPDNSNDNNMSNLQDQNNGSTQIDQVENLDDNNLITTESNVQGQGNNEYNTTPPGETMTTTTDVPTSTTSPTVNALVKTPDDDIMIIQIVKPNDDGTADAVYEMLDGVDLKKGTKDFVTQFNGRYELLPADEEDNNKWEKFSRAVVENFVLDFCNNYKVNTTQANATKSDDYDDDDEVMNYDETFNLAIMHLKEKRDMTAVQLAIPTRKMADIFESVLDTPVGIVQSRCQDYMKKWQCNAQYLARLTDESETCGSIWNHAKLHLNILMAIAQGTQSEQTNDPTQIVHEELQTSRRRSNNRSQRHHFKFVVRTLKRLRNRLQRSLTVQSQIFNELKKAQNSGELQCLKIGHVTRF